MSKEQEYKSKLIEADYHTNLWFEANRHYGGIMKGISHSNTIYISMSRKGIEELHSELKKAIKQGEEYQPIVIRIHHNEYAWLKFMKAEYEDAPAKVRFIVQHLSEYSGDTRHHRNIDISAIVLFEELSTLLNNIPEPTDQHEFNIMLAKMTEDGFLDDKGSGIYFKNPHWSPDRDTDEDYEGDEE